MNQSILEKNKFIVGLSPSADVIANNVSSDVVLARNYEKIVFTLALKTSGSNTGVGAITIRATPANTVSSPTAVPFKYSKLVAGQDGQGAITAATASGFSSIANEDAVYIIEVDPRDLPDDKPYVHLYAVESVNDPLVGMCLIECVEARYGALQSNVLS